MQLTFNLSKRCKVSCIERGGTAGHQREFQGTNWRELIGIEPAARRGLTVPRRHRLHSTLVERCVTASLKTPRQLELGRKLPVGRPLDAKVITGHCLELGCRKGC